MPSQEGATAATPTAEADDWTASGKPIWTTPERAAAALRAGRQIDYQPGDGTRYDCLLVGREHDHRRWLLIENLGGAILPLNRAYTATSYAVCKTAPVGCWAGLRPLLAALGHAMGDPVYNRVDAHFEADARAHGYDGEELDAKDARLGRLVRRAIEAER